MATFVRLDVKGTWMGTNHKSALGNEDEEHYAEEGGISCYRLDRHPAEALKDLFNYWEYIASFDIKNGDYKNMQVTVFEGDLAGTGSDMEEIATCAETLNEFDAQPFMQAISDAKFDFDMKDITREEYDAKLIDILGRFVK